MEKEPTAPPDLYPDLSGHEEAPLTGPTDYRLQEVSRLRWQLEEEHDKRLALYKKYHRAVNVLDGVDTTLLTAGMGLGISGVGLLSTVIAAPIVLGMELAALGCGLLGAAAKFTRRKLAVKAKKHNDLKTLAMAKLDTISSHVSAALVDNHISDEELRLIFEEVSKFHEIKGKIRAEAKKTHAAVVIDKATKNDLIKQGRNEAKAQFMKKLSGP
jgi:hypothetical protein